MPIAAGPPGALAAVAARGPDPLIFIPLNSALRRVAGIVLIAPPGAIVAVGTCLPASMVGALLGSALYVGTHAAPLPTRGAMPFIMSILPSKFDAVLAQLEAEPAGVGLVPGASYSSPEAFVAAVESTVARLPPAWCRPSCAASTLSTRIATASSR